MRKPYSICTQQCMRYLSVEALRSTLLVIYLDADPHMDLTDRLSRSDNSPSTSERNQFEVANSIVQVRGLFNYLKQPERRPGRGAVWVFLNSPRESTV